MRTKSIIESFEKRDEAVQKEQAKDLLTKVYNSLPQTIDKQTVLTPNTLNLLSQLYDYSKEEDHFSLKKMIAGEMEKLPHAMSEKINAVVTNSKFYEEIISAYEKADNTSQDEWGDWGDLDEEGEKIDAKEYARPEEQTKEERRAAKWADVVDSLDDESRQSKQLEKMLFQPELPDERILQTLAKHLDWKDGDIALNESGENLKESFRTEESRERLEDYIAEINKDPDKVERLMELKSELPSIQHEKADKDPDEGSESAPSTPRFE